MGYRRSMGAVGAVGWSGHSAYPRTVMPRIAGSSPARAPRCVPVAGATETTMWWIGVDVDIRAGWSCLVAVTVVRASGRG
jgi:hypothetical protein